MYENLNDYELLDQVADNEFATETLFEKYKPLIYGIAKKAYYTHQNTGLEMNDLIQEGMIGFSIAINTFDDQKKTTFFTYARTCIMRRVNSTIVAANRLKHQILNESISVEILDSETNTDNQILSDTKNNPEILLIENENVQEIKKIIDSELTEFEKKVCDLKTSGFDYKEIAEILNKTPKSIDNAFSRIKAKIQKSLEKKTVRNS